MQGPDFRDLLDYLVCDIKSKAVRADVRAELLDHLMTKYEIDRATGLTESQATEAAEKSLGDRELLHKALTKIHRRDGRDPLKLALFLLGSGYSYVFLQIFTYSFDLLLDFERCWASIPFFLFSLAFQWMLWRADRRLQPAMLLRLAVFVAGVTVIPFFSFGATPPAVQRALLIGLLAAESLQYLLMLLGLHRLTLPYFKNLAERLALPAASVMHVVNAGLIYYAFIRTGTGARALLPALLLHHLPETASVSLLAVAFCFCVLTTAAVAASLWLAYRQLKRNSVRLRFFSFSLKPLLAGAGLIAVSLFAAMCFYINQQPKTAPLQIADMPMAAEERARISAVLATYGVPDEVAALLPNSEMQNFASALPCREPAGNADYVRLRDPDARTQPGEYNDLKFHEYAILLNETERSMTVRFLCHIKYAENAPHAFRRRLEFSPFFSDAAPVNGPGWTDAVWSLGVYQAPALFIRPIYEKDGEKVAGAPLAINNYPDDAFCNRLSFDYAERGCTDCLFSFTFTASIKAPVYTFAYGTRYDCRRFIRPVSLRLTQIEDSHFGVGLLRAEGYISGDADYVITSGAQQRAGENTLHRYSSIDSRAEDGYSALASGNETEES